MEPYPATPRHDVVAAVLQFYWHDIDPDSARTLAERIIYHLDRLAERQAREREKAA